ncbi:P-loop containing nucleoside triphosphate hydrolase protein [Haematococcus lacustris]
MIQRSLFARAHTVRIAPPHTRVTRPRRSTLCSAADSAGAPSPHSAGFHAHVPDSQLDTVHDPNILHTLDYQLAARIRDQLRSVQAGQQELRGIDWASLGLPAWISDRLERLGFRFTTEIQRRAAPIILDGRDAVLQSQTGSGKTLAFLAPLLARLQYPPQLYLEDLKGPQALVLVPSLELGVQCALLLFKLLGGNISQGQPGDPANLFTYTGPQAIKVRGLLNKEEVAMACGTDYLKAVHVVVATPAALQELCVQHDTRAVLQHLRCVVVDEFDEVLRIAPEATALALNTACSQPLERPQVVLVGATLSGEQVQAAEAAGWLQAPVLVQVGPQRGLPAGLNHRYAVCDGLPKLAALARLLRADMHPGGQHEPQPARVMVFTESPEAAAAATVPLRDALWGEHQLAVLLPPSTQLPQAPSDTLAQHSDDVKAATSHELASTSPHSASDPIRAMHSFRDQKTSLLICGPHAARGLDLPAVSHVYSLGLPEDEAQYLHRAGRAGRIGSRQGGIVTTLVTIAEVEQLQAMAVTLGITLSEVEVPRLAGIADMGDEAPDDEALDRLRHGLEDLYTCG